MKTEESVLLEVTALRIGMYVELGVGWMAHPFPSGSFKITSQRQIETIEGLGLGRVRYFPGKSESPGSDVPNLALEPPADTPALTGAHSLEQSLEQQARRERVEQLAAQRRSLSACERRFGEAVRQYRKTVEYLPAQPKSAAECCHALVQGLVNEILGDGECAIRLLSEAAGEKTAMHPVNVTVLSLLLGKALGLQSSDLLDLGMAAFLHDVGKIQLPVRVRWIEDSFSNAETKIYQEHVSLGVKTVQAMDLSRGVLLAVAQHHELADGSGFPWHMNGASMTDAARILALVNRYDNMCNPLRAGAALTPHEALAVIFAQLKARYDSVTLSAFIRMMGVYPPGSVVQLIDDRYAIVVSVNSARPLKPRVIVHEPKISKDEALILDLEHAIGTGIRRSLKPANLPTAAQAYLAPRQRISYFFEKVVDAQMRELLA